MTFMDWNDRYELGVDAMDRQHRGLIDAMNRLYDRNSAGAPGDELLGLIDDLAELTQRHFAEEERHMESIDFVDLPKHKVVHQSLLRKLGEHRAAAVEAGRAPEAFFEFLRFWLSSHICGIDMKYAKATAAAAV